MSDCAFCDRTVFEERIIAEDRDFYVIATLGQITDGGYVLIFPKRHVRCMSALSFEEMVKFAHLFLDVRNIIALEYDLFLAVFEHGIAGQTILHAHIHLAPTEVDLTEQVKNDFPDALHESFDIVADGIPRRPANDLQPYLLWSSPEEYCPTHVWWDPQDVPVQYFRIALAEKLGRPERANWREMDPELDKRLWSDTVVRLKPYFS